MTMPGDHRTESRRFGLQIKLRQIMQNVNRNATEFDDLGLAQLERPNSFIDVATYGRERRNGSQFVENPGRANVPGVNDVLGPAQCRERLRAKQAVRIGNDADENGKASAWAVRAHQPVHLGMAGSVLHQLIRTPGLDFVHKSTQESHGRAHRPRTKADSLHAERN